MNDEKIIKWLESNNPQSKEDVYIAFNAVSHDIINYHIKQFFPNLLIDENINSDSKNNAKQISLRQQIMQIVCKNIHIKNKHLYIMFPDMNKATIRQYKKAALQKINEQILKETQSDEKLTKTDDINDLSSLLDLGKHNDKKESDGKNDMNQQPKLSLKELENKAYEKNKATIQNDISIDIEKLLEKLIKDKLVNIESDLSKFENCQKQHETDIIKLRENFLTSEEQINKKLEDIIDRILTEKIQKLGMNILGKIIENAVKHINLSFGK